MCFVKKMWTKEHTCNIYIYFYFSKLQQIYVKWNKMFISKVWFICFIWTRALVGWIWINTIHEHVWKKTMNEWAYWQHFLVSELNAAECELQIYITELEKETSLFSVTKFVCERKSNNITTKFHYYRTLLSHTFDFLFA